jgi:flagellar hook-associated protein 1
LGTLFSTLAIARSGLQVAQIQTDITGHNIANVNKEGFSRQRVQLLSPTPNVFPFGQIGRGVMVGGIDRIRDAFLDGVFRNQVPGLGSAEVQAQYFSQLQDLFLEPSGIGFGTRLDTFFDALGTYSNNVESLPVREALLAESSALAGSFNEISRRLFDMRTASNEQVKILVPQINSLGERIVDMNVQIRQAELNGTTANDLRDDRDVLLDELAKLVNITSRERENGEVEVLIGSTQFVSGNFFNEVEAVSNPALDPDRTDLVQLQTVEFGEVISITDGEVFGAINVRDTVIPELDARLDTLAGTLIQQINAIQSAGRGLSNRSGTITSTNPTTDAVTALGAAGLPFAVTPGTFDVVVYDAAGVPTTTTITITATTTLTDLAADLGAIADFSASVVGTDTLSLGTSPPFTFSFQNDTSGVLAALGVNSFFTGSDASDMAISSELTSDPTLIASGFNTDPLATGDNTAALAMAALRDLVVLDANTSTMNDFYEATIVQLGVDTRTNLDRLEVEMAFVDDFNRRRQEISGVNLDEEVTNLIQFQRAFEGSARVITIVDRMLETLVNIIR